MTTCCICDCTFDARHSYGLCSTCFSRDVAREFDRLENAKYKAQKQGLAATLTLKQLLATLSDFNGKCSYCSEYPCSHIEIVEPAKGLTYDNVVPSCRACHKRRNEGYSTAEHHVLQYLSSDRTPHNTEYEEMKRFEEETC